MREKFSILVDKISVEDYSETEVDETVFAELATQNGICFIIRAAEGNGKFERWFCFLLHGWAGPNSTKSGIVFWLLFVDVP